MVMSFKGKDILREWKPNENFNEFIKKRAIHFQSIFLKNIIFVRLHGSKTFILFINFSEKI